MTTTARWPVSVVIPARDAERYLGEALASVLGQTVPVHEVIVVDDGSTDTTAAIADDVGPPVRVLRIPPSGIGTARNTGVAAATGTLIALCDADDVWLPEKLERQLELVDDPDDAVVVFCGMDEFWSPDLPASARVGRSPRTGVEECRLSSAALLTRPALAAAGPFLEGASVGEWVPWCIRLCDAATVRHAPAVLFRRRLHDRNTSLLTGERTAMWTHALHERLRAARRDVEARS